MPEEDKPDAFNLDKVQDSGTVSFWRSLACAGHTAVLFHSGQDSYILGFGPFVLFDDTSLRQKGLNIPIIKGVPIPPPDKVPKLLS